MRFGGDQDSRENALWYWNSKPGCDLRRLLMHSRRTWAAVFFSRGADGEVSKILREIKEPPARKAIEYLRQHAPAWLARLRVQEGERVRHRFWQPGGGYDRNVIELRTVHEMIDYLHANPIRRGLVERAVDWEWSSARWYAGIRPVPIEMDRTIPSDLG